MTENAIDRIIAYNDPRNGTVAERVAMMLEDPTEWPRVRVAHKDGEFIVLWPGVLSSPYRRDGWEIQEYVAREAADG